MLKFNKRVSLLYPIEKHSTLEKSTEIRKAEFKYSILPFSFIYNILQDYTYKIGNIVRVFKNKYPEYFDSLKYNQTHGVIFTFVVKTKRKDPDVHDSMLAIKILEAKANKKALRAQNLLLKMIIEENEKQHAILLKAKQKVNNYYEKELRYLKRC